jgi:predicted small secreted protein
MSKIKVLQIEDDELDSYEVYYDPNTGKISSNNTKSQD